MKFEVRSCPDEAVNKIGANFPTFCTPRHHSSCCGMASLLAHRPGICDPTAASVGPVAGLAKAQPEAWSLASWIAETPFRNVLPCLG